ncbi:TIGR01459 family HAD-type hydrolase [Pseudooceanicola algae]|uniref:Acid sugar phosphatase n=1 Tax=Pseudooceanicola algae TaxID=1537215 RepID=A0A418SI66_9RHOB|nr:TIGR01459 family HAD-type hydrolase [Pseudooceanicola algae]QPM92125.1 Acid sugar phosphatase [Pseudooceanicola algae]
MTRIIASLAEISDDYDALFVDLWGCLHNGVTAFPEAVAALQAYRKRGGTVVLLTNSPRTRAEVEKQLVGFGAPDDCWDTIATSGDSARAAMFQGAVGRKVYFIGSEAESHFFEPMNLLEDPTEITRVPVDEAEGIVCTGHFDPMAAPDVLRPQLLLAKTRGIKLLCANPDIVVDRGELREWCAGAVAALYTEMGGESLYFGKPHPPIYDLARLRLAATGVDISSARVLAIGDGIRTDVEGALGENIDSLFITGGLAAQETLTTDQPEPQALKDYIATEQLAPSFAIGKLR